MIRKIGAPGKTLGECRIGKEMAVVAFGTTDRSAVVWACAILHKPEWRGGKGHWLVKEMGYVIDRAMTPEEIAGQTKSCERRLARHKECK
jgi:hypothetical protein